jgi:hypothetical protein
MAQCERFDGNAWHEIAELPNAMTKLGIAELSDHFYLTGWPSEHIYDYTVESDTFRALACTIQPNFHSVMFFNGECLWIMREVGENSHLLAVSLEIEEVSEISVLPDEGCWAP